MGPEAVVLFSGGWESSYCLLKARQKEKNLLAYFVDYAQPYFHQESEATRKIAHLLGVELFVDRISTISTKVVAGSRVGIFPGRNEAFLTACLKQMSSSRVVYFGCRNILDLLDPYRDSNKQWALRMEKKHGIKIYTPCVALPKWYIIQRVSKSVPRELVFSSRPVEPLKVFR